MSIRILSVGHGSLAEKSGILPGEILEQINFEDIIDDIDYQALTMQRKLVLSVRDQNAVIRNISISKAEWEPLGLCLDETITLKPRHCHNHCIFCFVDQLPSGMRKSLYVKDDDWRLSLMMGNYITLTNVDDGEFNRILKRKASPLYISVHATDPDTRIRMMSNPDAGLLMKRLNAFRDNGIRFHCQVVLCPGYNDGNVLDKTINDLASFYPFARSLAVVPVGLTAHRTGLPQIKPFDKKLAASLIKKVSAYQDLFCKKLGTRFVYPSDEFFCLSGLQLPDNDYYEDYPQIENGVGMLRLLEQDCAEYIAENNLSVSRTGHIVIPTGISAAPLIGRLSAKYAPSGVSVEVIPVRNRYFGESITVTGLLVGADIENALRGKECDEILISSSMLREGTDLFLDDICLSDLRNALQKKIRIVDNTGESFINALYGTEDI